MTRFLGNERTLRKALIFSVVLHILLFSMFAISPNLPQPPRKGMVHYVSFGSLRGGGGEGGGGGKVSPPPAAAEPAKKESLRDLTVPSKIKPEPKPSMTYPVDKSKNGKKTEDGKKAVLTKPQPNVSGETARAGETAGSGTGSGSGLRIGLGEAPGGGFGSGYSDQVGLSSFPYQYYLQIITDRVSASWFTSLVDPGVSGTFYTTVYFKILKNGQVSDLKIAESSGIPSLDISAQRAIQTTAPFPPLPSDYEGDYLGIHLIFEHSK